MIINHITSVKKMFLLPKLPIKIVIIDSLKTKVKLNEGHFEGSSIR
jgi:hypothetical protein